MTQTVDPKKVKTKDVEDAFDLIVAAIEQDPTLQGQETDAATAAMTRLAHTLKTIKWGLADNALTLLSEHVKAHSMGRHTTATTDTASPMACVIASLVAGTTIVKTTAVPTVPAAAVASPVAAPRPPPEARNPPMHRPRRTARRPPRPHPAKRIRPTTKVCPACQPSPSIPRPPLPSTRPWRPRPTARCARS